MVCSVCEREDADLITEALRGGASLRQVSDRYGIHRSVLAPHARQCAGVELPDRKLEREKKAERLKIIREMMLSGAWVKGKSAGLLADEWGMSAHTLDDYAAEASHQIRALIDPEAVRQVGAEKLRHFVDKATAQSDDPRAIAAGVQAVKTWAELVGAMAPKKQEVAGPGGVPLGLGPRATAMYPRLLAGDPEAVALFQRWREEGGDDLPLEPKAAS